MMRIRRVAFTAGISGVVAILGAVAALAFERPPASAPAMMRPATHTVAPPSLAAAVSSLATADDNHVSVAVENLGTKTSASYNVSNEYVTASIVKLDILCTLLYQSQLSAHAPSASELALTKTMIEDSNNDAAQHLFEDVGGSSAITAANRVFGLTDTAVETNSLDEAGYSWGDTTTTALDQLQLLRQVFTADSVLAPANRDYIKNLMGHVESDQRWGISAAADDPSPSGSDYMLKNGWLPRRGTGLWEINSIGEVQYHGQQYLIAVLSNSNKSMDSGIGIVQLMAESARAAVSG